MLLDEQLNSSMIRDFVNENLIVIRVLDLEIDGIKVSDTYGIRVAPSLVVLDKTGAKIDNMDAPYRSAYELKEKLELSMSGENTLPGLEEKYADNPENLKIAFDLGVRYRDIRQRNKAIEIFDMILSRPEEAKKLTTVTDVVEEPVDLYQYSKFYRIYSGGNNSNSESETWIEFLEEFPDSPMAYYAYSWATSEFVFGENPDTDKGYKLFKSAIEKFPHKDTFPYYFMLFAKTNKQYMEEALEIGARFLRNDRNPDGFTVKTYADLLSEVDDRATLYKIYGKDFADRRFDSFKRDITVYISFWKNREDAPSDLMDIAQALHALDPKSVSARRLLALLYLKDDNVEKASEMYGEKYVEITEMNTYSMNSYARFWAEKGLNLESALKVSRDTIELDDDNANYWDTLSLVYWKIREYQKAIEAEETALKYRPDYKPFLERIESIKKDMKKGGGI
ncbi:tetratricopeptide repeat protein [candidate division KSB1 bacterium]